MILLFCGLHPREDTEKVHPGQQGPSKLPMQDPATVLQKQQQRREDVGVTLSRRKGSLYLGVGVTLSTHGRHSINLHRWGRHHRWRIFCGGDIEGHSRGWTLYLARFTYSTYPIPSLTSISTLFFLDEDVDPPQPTPHVGGAVLAVWGPPPAEARAVDPSRSAREEDDLRLVAAEDALHSTIPPPSSWSQEIMADPACLRPSRSSWRPAGAPTAAAVDRRHSPAASRSSSEGRRWPLCCSSSSVTMGAAPPCCTLQNSAGGEGILSCRCWLWP